MSREKASGGGRLDIYTAKKYYNATGELFQSCRFMENVMLFKRRFDRANGNALVEVIFVLAIIAILAAIAILHYTKIRESAYITELKSYARDSFVASQLYLTDYPTATITTVEQLYSAGLRLSPNVDFAIANMTVDEGIIVLRSNKVGDPFGTAVINAKGRIVNLKDQEGECGKGSSPEDVFDLLLLSGDCLSDA